MAYLLVFLSAICLAVQFCTNKGYQAKCGSSMKTSFKFLALKGIYASVAFFILAFIIYKRPLKVTPISLILAAIVSLFICLCWSLGFVIYKYGPMSLYSTYMMIGGMLLPFLFGVFALGDGISIFRMIGIILLVISLILPIIGKNGSNESDRRSRALFILLCAVVFIGNGCVSIFSSIHSGDAAFSWFDLHVLSDILPNMSREKVEPVEFTVLMYICNTVFSSIGWLILSLRERHERRSDADTCTLPARISAKERGQLALLVIGCATSSAVSYIIMRIVDGIPNVNISANYPIQTGGTVLLTALAGFMVFREKPSKTATAGLVLTFLSTLLFLF